MRFIKYNKHCPMAEYPNMRRILNKTEGVVIIKPILFYSAQLNYIRSDHYQLQDNVPCISHKTSK